MGNKFSKWDHADLSQMPPDSALNSTRKYTRKKRILLIGTHGCGKSTLINTFHSAVFGEYRELAITGQGTRGHISVHLKKYDFSGVPCAKQRVFSENSLPIVYDMCGVESTNALDDHGKNVLKAILRGEVAEGTNIARLLHNKDAPIPSDGDGVPMDRVIFVAALNEELPIVHIHSVYDVCREVFGPEFPIFGILTKCDQVPIWLRGWLPDKWKAREKRDNFVRALRAEGNEYRVIATVGYCREICQNRDPSDWYDENSIDKPILAFLARLYDDCYDKLPLARDLP